MPKEKLITKYPKCGERIVRLPDEECQRLCTFRKVSKVKRIKLICNNYCGQEFWYYPRTGEITLKRK